MAANIFDQADYQNIISRIEALEEIHAKNWGKMNIVQMLQHCAIQLKLGLGIIPHAGPEGSAIMRTGLGRWLTLYAIPWPKGLPTPSKMNMVDNEYSVHDFETEKKSLLVLLEEVQRNPNLHPHPFFGAMNATDWGRLIWKHLAHYLRQFGG